MFKQADPEGTETIVFIRINSCQLERRRVVSGVDLKNAPAVATINRLVAGI